MKRGGAWVPALCLWFSVLLAPVPGHATQRDDSAPATPRGKPAPLNLRLPPQAMASPASGVVLSSRLRGRTLQFEARKSFIEWGVEASREALIACQKGEFPGATVAAYGGPAFGAESQPDHCYRF